MCMILFCGFRTKISKVIIDRTPRRILVNILGLGYYIIQAKMLYAFTSWLCIKISAY